MSSLPTIVVQEHTFIPVTDEHECGLSLSEGDARLLDRLTAMRPGFCQRVVGGIKLAQYCGIVRLKTCVLEVLPKIGNADTSSQVKAARSRAALLNMLRRSPDITITEAGTASQNVAPESLLDVFIASFLDSALARARQGLLSRYVPIEAETVVLKGRFDATAQMRQRIDRSHFLRCVYDDFTADNEYNQAIRASLNVCRSWITKESTKRLWSETNFRYSNVSSRTITVADVQRLPKDRTTKHYLKVLSWCEVLLRFCSPGMVTGHIEAPALLFDMNKLFESHVAVIEKSLADEAHVVVRSGVSRPLAMRDEVGVFSLKPDITVWRALPGGERGDLVLIVDAKWKHLDPAAKDWDIAASDVYQMLAYAVRYECRYIKLVFPKPDELGTLTDGPVFRIAFPALNEDREIKIEVVLLPILAQISGNCVVF
jgi:5-methylcytosine-specific restriction enzyme subunit McrC